MKITPLDIQKKSFRRILRGFDPEEVEVFLGLVAGELEEVLKENIALQDEVRRSVAGLEEYREREKVLQETLVTAQRITGDIKEQARKEAEHVVAEAEARAERIVADARQRMTSLVEEIRALKGRRAQVEAEIRGVLDGHRALLDALREHDEAADKVAFMEAHRKDAGGEGAS